MRSDIGNDMKIWFEKDDDGKWYLWTKDKDSDTSCGESVTKVIMELLTITVIIFPLVVAFILFVLVAIKYLKV